MYLSTAHHLKFHWFPSHEPNTKPFPTGSLQFWDEKINHCKKNRGLHGVTTTYLGLGRSLAYRTPAKIKTSTALAHTVTLRASDEAKHFCAAWRAAVNTASVEQCSGKSSICSIYEIYDRDNGRPLFFLPLGGDTGSFGMSVSIHIFQSFAYTLLYTHFFSHIPMLHSQ